MKLTDENTNYSAVVVRVDKLVETQTLDELVLFPVDGMQALVSKNTQIGDIGLLFPTECKISSQFISENNIFRNKVLNKDPQCLKNGYFEDTGRVKAIKIRGNTSNAFFISLDSLSYLGIDISEFKEGDSFTHINDVEICRKYVIKQTQSSTVKNKTGGTTKKFKRVDVKLFPQHFDTAQYFRNKTGYKDNDWVTCTQKLHGCVSGDTIVDTVIGPKTIKEIVDNKINCKIKAFNVHTNNEEFVDISDYYFKANDGDWYEIELEDGTKIEITGNNPVWLPELNCYRKVENLLVGDVLLKNNT